MECSILRRSDLCFVPTFLLALCFIALGGCSQYRSIDQDTARALARAYALNNPGSVQEMEAFVGANRSFFVSNGAAIQAMNSLGGKLMQAGINAFDPQALDRASRTGGPPEMAGEVARKLNSGAAENLCMGQELAWLALVLPYAAQGDWRPYLVTKPMCRGLTHQDALTKLEQLRQIISSSGNSQNMQLYQSLLLLSTQVVMPLTEQQMFLMAVMYGG